MTQRKKHTSDGDERAEKGEAPGMQAEIEQTRTEISDDLRKLGEKLSPERLKQDAKEVMQDAKSVAVETLHEAGDVATNKLREVKDSAVETVHEKVDDLRNSVRNAGRETRYFFSENAVPLALMGIGAAWFISKRRERSSARQGGYGESHYSTAGRTRWRAGSALDRGRSSEGGVGERVRGAADKAGERFDEVKGRVRDFAERETDHVRRLAQDVEHRVGEGTAQARDFVGRELREARDLSRRMSEENPLATGLAAIAAGIGVGLLLPQTRPERELLGTKRDELVGEAKQALSDMTETAKETAREVKSALGGAAPP